MFRTEEKPSTIHNRRVRRDWCTGAGTPARFRSKRYPAKMLWISELILQNQPSSFEELVSLVRQKALTGDRFLRMDVKPPYPDTPENWEDRLEAVFTSAVDVGHRDQDL